MFAQKHPRAASFTDHPPVKGQVVHVRTVEKWVAEKANKVLNALIWLQYERADHNRMRLLECTACPQFNNKLVFTCMWNCHLTIAKGTTNVCASCFKELAVTDMHTHTMVLFKRQQSSTICKNVPITKALLQPSTDGHIRVSLKWKFDIAYMIAKEKLALITDD